MITLISGNIIVYTVQVLLLSLLLYRTIYSLSITDTTGTVSYSTSSYGSAQWDISPPSTSRILLIFSSLATQSLELFIYDLKDFNNNGLVLYSCISCGQIKPPVFYSNTGYVVIKANYAGTVQGLFNSFSIQFVSERNVLVPINLNVKVNMGYGTIGPVLSQGSFVAQSNQTWLIAPYFTTSTFTNVTLSISQFKLPSTCGYMGIIIMDPVNKMQLANVCKQSDVPRLWVVSPSGQMLITIVSFVTTTYSNFKLTYYSDVTQYNCGSFSDPDVLSDDSFLITDGSATNDDMKRGQTCRWVISPASPSSTITLIFSMFNIKSGASVVITDSAGVSLYSCQSNCVIVPPPLITTSNTMLIQYTSDSALSLGYTGFLGSYMSNFIGSMGMGNLGSVLRMSSAYDIQLPGDGEVYVGGLKYTWLLLPSAATGKITVVLERLSLGSCSDRFSIFDGQSPLAPLLFTTSCGLALPSTWVMSSTTAALVTFHAGGMVGSLTTGYARWSYFSDGGNYHCGFPVNPLLLTVDSITVTDGSQSTADIYSNQRCEWLISPSNMTAIYLFFNRMNANGGALSIYAGGSVSQATLIFSTAASSPLSSVPPPLLVRASALYIVYQSGPIVSGTGFSLTYFAIRPPPAYSLPGDGLLRMTASSVASYLPPQPLTAAPLTVLIQPQVSRGRIYISAVSAGLRTGACVEFFDGPNSSSVSLAKYCDDSILRAPWVASSGPLVSATIVGGADTSYLQMSYFSDGPSFSCSYTGSRGQLFAASGVITDGSASWESMYPNQLCSWLINPASSVFSSTLVIELLSMDMGGGDLLLYDGTSESDTLILACSSCSSLTPVLISRSGAVLITFRSYSAPSGSGFSLVYWRLNATDSQSSNSTGGVALSYSSLAQMDSNLGSNASLAWNLPVTSEKSVLLYSTSAVSTHVKDVTASCLDGRPSAGVEFSSVVNDEACCGHLISASTPFISTSQIHVAATQEAAAFILTSIRKKVVVTTEIIQNPELSEVGIDLPYSSATLCKYHLDSGSTTASLVVSVIAFYGLQGGRLRIYGGLHGTDALLLDANSTNVLNLQLIAPCGRASLVIEAFPTPMAATPEYSVELEYSLNPEEDGQVCTRYAASLLVSDKSQVPWETIIIACSVTIALLLCAAIAYYMKDLQKNVYRRLVGLVGIFRVGNGDHVVQQVVAHPRYTPKLDSIKNKFLRKGSCCICNEDALHVLPLQCDHALCLPCVNALLQAALHDISLFPVKCPMHYEGCETLVDAKVAKRFLVEFEYKRFLDFQDRAIFGEGMRCIFCTNYVKFSTDNSTSIVGCVHCHERFCLRCRQPYTVYHKCPLEQIDDSLEIWKKQSGAQKCPVCRKLIEKEGEETCNHMVHKISDGIPCVRERTDFCYLCGGEVTGSYPHVDVGGSCGGLNHFPEGVFQKCRVTIEEEYRLNRLRSKKVRKLAAIAPDPLHLQDPVGSTRVRNNNAHHPRGRHIDQYFDV